MYTKYIYIYMYTIYVCTYVQSDMNKYSIRVYSFLDIYLQSIETLMLKKLSPYSRATHNFFLAFLLIQKIHVRGEIYFTFIHRWKYTREHIIFSIRKARVARMGNAIRSYLYMQKRVELREIILKHEYTAHSPFISREIIALHIMCILHSCLSRFYHEHDNDYLR